MVLGEIGAGDWRESAVARRNTVAETIPDVIVPASPADYFEVMTRAVFQAGVRWKQIAEH